MLVAPSASWLGADLDALDDVATVVAYDLRGRGRSSAVLDEARLSLDHDVADLGALLDALGLGRVALLGWSYHALIVARLALERPERVERLLLVGPSPPVQQPWWASFLDRFAARVDPKALDEVAALQRARTKERDLATWSRAVHGVFLRAYVADPSALERMRSTPWVEPNLDPDRVNAQGRRVIERLGDYDLRPRLGELACPVLVVHGDEDPVDPAGSDEWLAAVPDARILRLPGVGHMPWLERPDVFFPAVRTFLDGRWPAGAVGRGR